MNINYKILWIEDDIDYISITSELIKETVQNNYMIADIVSYSDYDEYRLKVLDVFDFDSFNLYDLIIVDYALSGITGDIIISDLRGRKIYTDIVFYSSDFDSMMRMLSGNNQLDGVFWAPRNNIIDTVDRVIKKNLRREYSIANIRGLIMDSTSDFDYICRVTSMTLLEKLPVEKKQYVIETARQLVENARKKSEKNFKALDKKDGSVFLESALGGVWYVMDTKDRYIIMSLIVREFDNNPVFGDEFANNYSDALIMPRNQLAHNKLYYGHCNKKLHIARNKQVLECDMNCEHCDSKYSIEDCNQLREKIFNYYRLFNHIGGEEGALY